MKTTKIFLLLTTAMWATDMFRAYAQTPTCPRIERRGDTLFAVPADAPSYRWYKNGAVWTGQTRNFAVMDESADYSVEVFGVSSPFNVAPITAKLSGRVFDPLMQPVAGATVRLGNQTRSTDAQGRYVFDEITVLPGRNVVKIEKTGYFSAQTAVYFTAGAPKTAATMLHPKDNPVTFHSTHGSLVHNAVFSLNIPPNAVARADGTPYNGPVTLHYKHLSPEYPYFGFGMPGGDFLATTTTGETVTLTSYGVVGVELTDAAGNPLNLRQGSTARIAMRIPDGLQNRPTAALWHFDENAGIWREETTLTAKGAFLTGKVSHFSWWNMDYYGPSGAVRGRVVDCGGNPIAEAPFCINQMCRTTDENGFFRVVRVPAGQNNSLTTNGQTLHFTLNEGDTLDVGDINGGSTLIAAGLLAWDNINQTTATLTVFANGGAPPFEYSLDSLTWQNENIFTGLTETAYSVWIREPNGCVAKIETYLQRLGAGCWLPEDTQLSSLPVYTSWFSALEAYNQGLPIYRYASCENIELVVANFVCLRELNLSNCGLTNLPEGLSNLVGLEILRLAGNPLDTVPAVVFSMPNLELLDMRWTNVPVGDRTGYEANLPGVTVYWEACDEPSGWAWATRAGGTGWDWGCSVAAHADGSVTVTGRFEGTADFGGVTLTAAGSHKDIFVARYDASGNVLWAQRAGGTGEDEGRGVAAHADGSVTVTGSFRGTADFGGVTLTAAGQYSDIFVARYDASGNVLWAQRAGGTGWDEGRGVAAHADGSVTVTGSFRGTADFGGVTLTAAGTYDIFVARYDASGNVLWAQRAGGTGEDVGWGVAAHADGSVTVTGRFEGTADFGGVTLTAAGSYDIFMARYDASGNVLWAQRAGGTGWDEGRGVAAHADGSVTVTGSFRGTADFGGVTLTAAGTYDIFVARYDASGNVLWAQRAGGTGEDVGWGVAAHADGSVTVTGQFEGPADFGGVTLTAAGTYDIFVARYDASGNVLWAQRAGGTGEDVGWGCSVAAHADGSVTVKGLFSGTADFGGVTLTAAGYSDIFVARICPE